MAQLPNSEHSLHMLRRVAHLWAEHDREGAMQWGAAQEDPAVRQHALGGVVEIWAHTDPAAAAVFAAGLQGSYERLGALEVAARRWASQSTVEAMEWARELPVGDRQRATVAILREVAESDPGHAAAMYEELTAELSPEGLQGGAYRRMAQEIASVWSSSSPAEAAAWAVKLPEAGEVRRGAVADVAEHWLGFDSAAAGEWILQLPEGRTRDAATERVVGTFVHTDPATAFSWASSASDEGHRFGMMREVLKRWQVTDPAAAQAALNAAEVPPEQRRELSEVFAALSPPARETAGDQEAAEQLPE
ncbi:MAG: hypothetical protein GWO24_28820 [Akkermansiaceae bacterium]|nr:hypothetical protein [Akkermansiaceae bacterium]